LVVPSRRSSGDGRSYQSHTTTEQIDCSLLAFTEQGVTVSPLSRRSLDAETASVYTSASAPLKYHERLFLTKPAQLDMSAPATSPVGISLPPRVARCTTPTNNAGSDAGRKLTSRPPLSGSMLGDAVSNDNDEKLFSDRILLAGTLPPLHHCR